MLQSNMQKKLNFKHSEIYAKYTLAVFYQSILIYIDFKISSKVHLYLFPVS